MTDQPTDTRSVLARLRALPWGRAASNPAAMRSLAERQAQLLRYLTAHRALPLEQVIGQLPRIRVHAADIPTSGLSHWDGHEWVITLNAFEPRTRQRFTLLNEYKHIIDHPNMLNLYHDRRAVTAAEQREQAADYFAGCALVPRELLTDAWNSGTTAPAALADFFDVSVPAINVRLLQVGLVGERQRCAPPRSSSSRRNANSERLAA